MKRGLLLLLAAAAAAGVRGAERRDPFVPVGYRPPEPPPAVTSAPPVETSAPPVIVSPPPPKEEERPTALEIENIAQEQMKRVREQIRVQGVFSSSGKFMAVLNSQIVRVGEVITVGDTAGPVWLRVKSIDRDNVVLERVEQGPAPENGASMQGGEP